MNRIKREPITPNKNPKKIKIEENECQKQDDQFNRPLMNKLSTTQTLLVDQLQIKIKGLEAENEGLRKQIIDLNNLLIKQSNENNDMRIICKNKNLTLDKLKQEILRLNDIIKDLNNKLNNNKKQEETNKVTIKKEYKDAFTNTINVKDETKLKELETTKKLVNTLKVKLNDYKNECESLKVQVDTFKNSHRSLESNKRLKDKVIKLELKNGKLIQENKLLKSVKNRQVLVKLDKL